MNINIKSILEKIDMDTIDLTNFNEGSMTFLTSITVGSDYVISKCVNALKAKIEKNEVHPDILWVSALLILGRKDINSLTCRNNIASFLVLLNLKEPPYTYLSPLINTFLDTTTIKLRDKGLL